MKACTRCGEVKPLSAFPWSDKAKGLIHSWCKGCKVAYQREWQRRPEVREARALYERQRGAAVAARLSMRRAQMSNATPPWLTAEQRAQIKAIYRHAADCSLVGGSKYQVDHIIPLHAIGICGLHVPWNLQVLPRDLNAQKGNSYDEPDRLR